MYFEFDPKKSRINLFKHGIDFQQAQELWLDPNGVELMAKSIEGEVRYMLIARINSEYWSAIFTARESSLRIISVRRSRKSEKEVYDA